MRNADIVNVLGTYEMLAILSDNPYGMSDYQGIASNGATDRNGCQTFFDRHIIANLYALTAETQTSSKLFNYFNKTEMADISLLFVELDSTHDTAARSLNAPHNNADRALSASQNNADSLSPCRNSRAASLAEAIESINMASNGMFERLEKKACVSKLSAKVAGGGSTSRFWLRNKADITGWTLIVPKIHESAATGAALVAGAGCGAHASLEDAAHVYDAVETIVYKPDPIMHEHYKKTRKSSTDE